MSENPYIKIYLDDVMRDTILETIGDMSLLVPYAYYDPESNTWDVSRTIAGVQIEDLINRTTEAREEGRPLQLYDDESQRIMMCINCLSYVLLGGMMAEQDYNHQCALAQLKKPVTTKRFKNEYGILTRVS